MSRPPLPIDEDFFDPVETEEQAWVLGLITADGCISELDTQDQVILVLTDKDAVQQVKEYMGSEHKIAKKAPSSREYGGFEGKKSRYRLAFANQKIVDDLARYRVGFRKSYQEVPADEMLDESLRRHYWRGYFEGDGGVGTPSSCPSLSVRGSNDILESLERAIEGELGASIYGVNDSGEHSQLFINKKKNVEGVLDWLYHPSEAFIFRQRCRAEKAIGLIRRRRAEREYQKVKRNVQSRKFYVLYEWVGMSTNDIADELGVSRDTVERRLKDSNVDFRWTDDFWNLSERDRKLAKSIYDNMDYNMADIGRMFDVPYNTMTGYLKDG